MYKLWHDSYLIYARISSRTLHGSLIQDTDPDLVKLTGPILGRLTHQETLVPIFMCALIGTACLITAMVSIIVVVVAAYGRNLSTPGLLAQAQ